ncbi:MAG: 50S ribosomal protein L10 [Candidatus Hydrothermales bacterium]
MPSKQKIEAVEKYTKLLNNAKAIYVVDFKRFNVPEMNELRAKIKKENGLLKVGKNRLFKIALSRYNIKELDEFLKNVSALLIAYNDPVNPLKVFYEFIKEKGKGDIKGGYIEGKKLEKSEVEIIAKLPPKGVLLQDLISKIQSPLYGLIFTLNGLIRNLLYVLNEIKVKKEGSNP